MARPQRKNVDYFPHEAGSGKKMYYIENKYGNDGYAVWYKILEELAAADNHFLNLEKFENVMFLSAKCKVDENKLFQIIEDLVKMNVFDSLAWDKKIIWCEKFIQGIQDAYLRRGNECFSLCRLYESFGIQKPAKCSTETPLNSQNDDSKPQSKVKEIRVNKTKEKESIQEAKNEGVFLPFDSKNFSDAWEFWKEYKRTQFKDKYKTTATEQIALKQLNKIANFNEQTAIAIIEQSIANTWKGLFELKKNNKNGNTKNKGFDAGNFDTDGLDDWISGN